MRTTLFALALCIACLPGVARADSSDPFAPQVELSSTSLLSDADLDHHLFDRADYRLAYNRRLTGILLSSIGGTVAACFLVLGGVYVQGSQVASDKQTSGSWNGLGEAMLGGIFLSTGILLFLAVESIGIPLAIQNDLRMRSIRRSARGSLQISFTAAQQAVGLGLHMSF